MTTFFLAEADGTSKFILEDGTGFLVGEDHVPDEYKAATININNISGVMALSAGNNQIMISGGNHA